MYWWRDTIARPMIRGPGGINNAYRGPFGFAFAGQARRLLLHGSRMIGQGPICGLDHIICKIS